MSYLAEFLTIALIHLLAVISPGPDFALISRNSLLHSRRAGIYTSIGLALGIMVHVAYSLIGIGLVISKSIVLFSIIKFLGAGYLIFIGYKSLKSKGGMLNVQNLRKKNDLEKFAAIRMGFLTNVLNPKVTLFFLSLFTQVVDPHTPFAVQLAYGLEMSLATFAWFSFVAIVLSQERIKSRFVSVQHYFEKVFGTILILLGVKVALSNSK